MMAKIVKGDSFGGCVRYVTGKKDAKLLAAEGVLLAAEGVLLDSKQSVVDSFEAQSLLNPRLGRKVGHISLNFSAQDAAKVSDAFMAKIANEYMQKMGIVDTQFIFVRHNDREHPHCHIVFNRVDNNGATISDKNDRMRSVKACRAITERHGLYIASGKENVNRQRLRDPDSAKYAIYYVVKAALPMCKSWSDLERRLAREGIVITFKYSGGTDVRQGVIFGKDGYSFNGSKVDRAFSFSKLDATLNANAQRESRKMATQEVRNVSSQKPRNSQDVVPTPELTPAPMPAPSPQPDREHQYEPERGHHYEPRHSHRHSDGNIFSGFTFDPGPGEEDNGRPKPKKKKKREYKPSF